MCHRRASELGNVSSRAQLKSCQKAKHSVDFCQMGAWTVMHPQGVKPARAVDNCVSESLHPHPGHRFAFQAYIKEKFKICLFETVTERRRNNLLSTILLSRCPQLPWPLQIQEPGTSSRLPHGGRRPSTWAIFQGLPRLH